MCMKSTEDRDKELKGEVECVKEGTRAIQTATMESFLQEVTASVTIATNQQFHIVSHASTSGYDAVFVGATGVSVATTGGIRAVK